MVAVKHALGKGWRFPFQFTPIGGVAETGSSTDEETLDLLRGSIYQIIFTNQGERVVRRDFGSKLKSLIFELVDDDLDALLNNTVFAAIAKYEPRVDVAATNINKDRASEGVVDIMAVIRVKKTNAKGNVVLPYFNKGPQGKFVGP